MSINVTFLGIISPSQIKEEGVFQTNTTELFRPPDCDFMEQSYAKNSAFNLSLLYNASIQW